MQDFQEDIESIGSPPANRSKTHIHTSNDQGSEFTLLTSVAVVCDSNPRICGVKDIAWLIDSHLVPTSMWTVFKIFEKRLPSEVICQTDPIPDQLRLLKRIAALEELGDIDPYLKQKRFGIMLDKAVEYGGMNVIKWLVEEYFPTGVIRQAIRTAIRVVNLEFLQWVYAHHNNRVVWYRDILIYFPITTYQAANHVNIFAMVKWLHSTVAPADPNRATGLVSQAANLGDLEMLEWVLALKKEPDKQIDLLLHCAVRRNRKLVLEWAITRFDVAMDQSHMDVAVSAGQLELAQWIFDNGITTVSTQAIENAAQAKHFGTIAWALKKLIIPVNDVWPTNAARYPCGNLDITQQLHDAGVKFTHEAMDTAASGGHLDTLIWLHEHRTEGCTTAAMDGAAANNHLDVVMWLHFNRREGCTTDAMDQAATCGHLEVVRWLHENRQEGCTEQALSGAMDYGHLPVVKWLCEHRTEGCRMYAMDAAAESGHLDVIKFMYENDYASFTDEVMALAATGGDIEVIQWLHLQGEQVTLRAIQEAVEEDHTELLEWLLQHHRLDSACLYRDYTKITLENAILLYSEGQFRWDEGDIKKTSGKATPKFCAGCGASTLRTCRLSLR